MTPTHWLLLAIIVTLAVVLLSSWALVQLHRDENTPAYRTADSAAMQRDVRKLQALVPEAPPRARVRAGPTDTSHRLQGTQAQVRAQAITAALRDGAKGTSTANPYRQGSDAHAIWAQNYARLISDQQSLQEM